MHSNRLTHDDIDIIQKDILYSGFLRIEKFTLKHRYFSGEWSDSIQRECLERGESVAVLPYDPIRDRVVLCQQFRVGALSDPVSPWLIEIVAGMIDCEAESPEEVAVREAQEEAGLTVLELERICEYWVSPGGSSEKLHLYCAKVDAENCEGVFGLASECEDIRVLSVSREEAIEMLERGVINNSAAIIALQWLALHVVELREKWRT